MKKYLSLLLLLCSVSFAHSVSAQNRPRFKAKNAFSHASESGKGRNNRARFRKESRGGGFFDLHPHSIAQFTTAKSNKSYKFSKAK